MIWEIRVSAALTSPPLQKIAVFICRQAAERKVVASVGNHTASVETLLAILMILTCSWQKTDIHTARLHRLSAG
jgi:hypothetical protein